MSEEVLPLAMVASLFVLLLTGYPVAFTLGGVALIFGYVGLDFASFSLLPQRIYGIMQNITLLAVPLFIFMGVMLERSGLAEELLESMAMLFGRVKGGLAFSVILAGALLAASTGIVGASVVTMGLISLPVMLKRGYPAEFSSGVICASGTLGQIIPPSIVLVLLGDIIGQSANAGEVSVGRLFIAASVPGLILVSLYLLYSFFYCRFKLGEESLTISQSRSELFAKLFKSLLPPAVLMISVLGSIFFGVASPTEAASVGAFGAIVISAVKKRFSISILRQVMLKTTELTSMVFMILVGATAFSLVFRLLSGDDIIVELVQGMELGPNQFLLLVMVLLFILGCFLDFIEIVFIVVPILMPLMQEYGFDPLWFAVLIAVNLQMSFLTPPLGFALFYLKGVAPEGVTTGQIYRGIIPFVIIQAVVLLSIFLFPEIVTFFPEWWDQNVVFSDR